LGNFLCDTRIAANVIVRHIVSKLQRLYTRDRSIGSRAMTGEVQRIHIQYSPRDLTRLGGLKLYMVEEENACDVHGRRLRNRDNGLLANKYEW